MILHLIWLQFMFALEYCFVLNIQWCIHKEHLKKKLLKNFANNTLQNCTHKVFKMVGKLTPQRNTSTNAAYKNY